MDWTLEALRWLHAFELYLDAPLRAFPAGDYGHFAIERFVDPDSLIENELNDEVGASIFNHPDGFVCRVYAFDPACKALCGLCGCFVAHSDWCY